MKNAKTRFCFLSTLILFVLTIFMAGTAFAKTLYLVAYHHTGQFDAWNLNPDCTTNYLNTYTIHHSDPAGIAVWVPPEGSSYPSYIFISSEFSAGIEVVNGSTFQYVMTSSGPRNLAGVAVDLENDVVYALGRRSSSLYAYDWDPATESLTSKAGYPKSLSGTMGGYGIAYNEETDTLWVADGWGPKARAYNLVAGIWIEDTSKSFTPSLKPIDIVVDRGRDFVYTVSMSWGAGGMPGGSNLLSKYDLATGIETTVNMGRQGVGVAVDEVRGCVYVTHRYLLTVWDTSTSPFTQIEQPSVSGSAAGIVVPKDETPPPACPRIDSIDDGIAAGGCVNPGGTLAYQVSWSNSTPGQDCGPGLNATLVAELDPELGTPSSISDGGTYDSGTHEITWYIGDIPQDDPGATYQFVVPVSSVATPGGTITTFCTIDGDNFYAVTASVQTDVCVPTAPCCDLDGDNDCDIDDYYLFLSVYGTSVGDPGWIEKADYDQDGVVALPDFYEWYNCYWDYSSAT